METVHVVAINPYRKGNKGKVFSYNIDTYDKVIGSEEIKKMIQQIRGELPIDGVDLNDAQAVKKAQERLKIELPFFCPHYGMFKNNVRRQENALPESFLFQTIIDVDDKEYVEKAIEKARELNCSSGIWNGSLLHLCYSARKKLHIGIRMPVGMTIEETQKAYCEAQSRSHCTFPPSTRTRMPSSQSSHSRSCSFHPPMRRRKSVRTKRFCVTS